MASPQQLPHSGPPRLPGGTWTKKFDHLEGLLQYNYTLVDRKFKLWRGDGRHRPRLPAISCNEIPTPASGTRTPHPQRTRNLPICYKKKRGNAPYREPPPHGGHRNLDGQSNSKLYHIQDDPHTNGRVWLPHGRATLLSAHQHPTQISSPLGT
jgi:hypothetical protein